MEGGRKGLAELRLCLREIMYLAKTLSSEEVHGRPFAWGKPGVICGQETLDRFPVAMLPLKVDHFLKGWTLSFGDDLGQWR